MAVRLKDIAADLGVSMITVSKVLRNKPDVSAETRRRVLRKVEELNYKPNMMARGLASGRSYTLGLVVPDLVDSFFAEFAKSMGAALRGHSYQLLLASADQDGDVEQSEIENLLARGVDALLVASCRGKAGTMRASLRASVPFVLIDRSLPDLEAHFVGTDDRRAGQLATDHLAALGKRRIAHIGLGEGISTAVERLEGYREALAARELAAEPRLIVLCNPHQERGDQAGHHAMDQLLARDAPPDAVFCYNDLMAVGAIRSIRAHGLRVPEDVAVIGCGNLALSAYLEVPLSSVDQGTAELGGRAAQLALDAIEGKYKRTYQRCLVEPTLVVRASTMQTPNIAGGPTAPPAVVS